jgi:hypothetical protein
MQPSEGMRFVVETPTSHHSRESQAFIQQEIDRPSKVWVQEVVQSDRESEFVKLRTEEFVLLPDQNCNRRQARPFRARPQHPVSWKMSGPCQFSWRTPTKHEDSEGGWRESVEWGRWGGGAEPHHNRARSWPAEEGVALKSSVLTARADSDRSEVLAAASARYRQRFNWLAIVADPSLRSVRDLRGEHIGMLERLYEQCVDAIRMEYTGVAAADIMVFANYPPSVYKLHFHFCAPFFQPTAYDAFRVHSLSGIINNLKIHPLYYKISSFQIPVHSGSDLYRVVGEKKRDEERDADEGKRVNVQ